MKLETDTKYVKMKLRGGGSTGAFQNDDEETITLEYAIKNGVNVEKVREAALDSTLLVLMGNKVIAEISLIKQE